MKLQFAITHYYDPDGGGKHGSLSPDSKPRIKALREVILQLHRLFGTKSGVLNHHQRRVELSKEKDDEVVIIVCVHENKHLLCELEDLENAGGFRRVQCVPSGPKYLGFKCHEELSKNYKKFDYNCYLEDDIVIKDADFFNKLRLFNRSFGDEYLLQPNRIETSKDLSTVSRFYIDGDYNPGATINYRNSMERVLCMEHLGKVIKFKQPINGHSGCFFLNRVQSEKYFSTKHWENEDNSFHGPLESAATLGILKEFEIMKPVVTNGLFLSVEHESRNFIDMIEIK